MSLSKLIQIKLLILTQLPLRNSRNAILEKNLEILETNLREHRTCYKFDFIQLHKLASLLALTKMIFHF